MAAAASPAYGGAMGGEELSGNLDLLRWFTDNERGDCSYCGERESVSLPGISAWFCLRCGAISIAGMRIDSNGAVPV